MCNRYTNEHSWVTSTNTSRTTEPYIGQPCVCGFVLWRAAEHSMQLTGGISPVRKHFSGLRNIFSRLLALATRK